MPPPLKVGTLQAEAGHTETGVLQVPLPNRTVDVPVVAINGAHDGPRVAITAGIHPAEYVGVEAARRLGIVVDPKETSGSVVIVPVCNTTAFFARSIYTSGLDNENLNRLFPGRMDGSSSEALAHWLFTTIIRPSQYYIDLHGGDMIETLAPFVIYLPAGDEVEAASRSMALASGVRRVASDRVAGTAYASASEAGIPAITMEIGGQGVWDEEQVSQYVDACLGVLRHLGVLPGEQTLESGQRFYSSFNTITSSATGLWHPRVRVGETVDVGDRLGAMVDYFGTELQGIDAPVGGEVIYVVTSLAVNGGDPVLGITSRQ